MVKTKGITLLLGLALVGIILFQGGLLDNLIFGEPQECTVNPTHPKCFCPVGFVKVTSIPSSAGQVSSCVPSPDLPHPSSFTLPIDSWEEAIAFAENHIFPDSEPGTVCQGEWAYRNPVSGDFPIELFEEFPDGVLDISCTKITGSNSGQLLYELIFRPITSCIESLLCAEARAAELGLPCIDDVFDPTRSNCPLQ